jgi:transposase
MRQKKPKPEPQTKEFQIEKEELEALCARVAEGKIEPDDGPRLLRYLRLLLKLAQVLEHGRVRMRKLTRLLFGKRTEKDQTGKDTKKPGPGSAAASASPGAAESAAVGTGGQSEPGAPDPAPEKESPAKGHGRNPASAYENASEIQCPVCGQTAGDPCPLCGKGSLRPMAAEIIIRVQGSAPVTANRYNIERLRCATCGEIFKGKLPEDAGQDKYHASAKVSVVMMKYGSGLPFYRMEKQQGYQQIPLPVGTQWKLVEDAANAVLPVYLEMRRQTARAELLFIDDTWSLVLQAGKKQFTTGVVARVENHWTTLYLTGADAAGKKVLELLLAERPPQLPPPLQMSDALSSNYPDPLRVIVLLCWVHARRQFFEIKDFYPQECAPVLEAIRRLYQHEAEIQRRSLDDTARLNYHQQHSQPVLEQMKQWLIEQQEQRLIEPNSPLGKAVAYLKTHWDGLMGFCRHVGAPLDNNPVERILKLPILLRKNAYFFKTSHGADVGSLLMSLIKTATQSEVNPFSYLHALVEHRQELRRNPALWLPWNYHSLLRL